MLGYLDPILALLKYTLDFGLSYVPNLALGERVFGTAIRFTTDLDGQSDKKFDLKLSNTS